MKYAIKLITIFIVTETQILLNQRKINAFFKNSLCMHWRRNKYLLLASQVSKFFSSKTEKEPVFAEFTFKLGETYNKKEKKRNSVN